jgi:hypothetical protein
MVKHIDKTKDQPKKAAICEAQFLWIRPAQISQAELLERMRTFPERAAKFLEEFKAKRKREEG